MDVNQFHGALGGAYDADKQAIRFEQKLSRTEQIMTGNSLAAHINNTIITTKYHLVSKVSQLSARVFYKMANISGNAKWEKKGEVKVRQAAMHQEKAGEVFTKQRYGSRWLVPAHNHASRLCHKYGDDMTAARKLLEEKIKPEDFPGVDFSNMETGMQQHKDYEGICYAISIKFSSGLNGKCNGLANSLGQPCIPKEELFRFGKEFMDGASADVVAAHKLYSAAKTNITVVADKGEAEMRQSVANPNSSDISKARERGQIDYLMARILGNAEDINTAATNWLLDKLEKATPFDQELKDSVKTFLKNNPEAAKRVMDIILRTSIRNGFAGNDKAMYDAAKTVNQTFTHMFKDLVYSDSDNKVVVCQGLELLSKTGGVFRTISDTYWKELEGQDAIAYAALDMELTKESYIDPQLLQLNDLEVGSHVFSFDVGGGVNGAFTGKHAICFINAGTEGYYVMDPNYGVIQLDPSDNAAEGMMNFLKDNYPEPHNKWGYKCHVKQSESRVGKTNTSPSSPRSG